MEAKLYNQKAEESGAVKLPEAIFALPWNADLVHQVMLSAQSNRRTTIASTKGRGEVSGGGKKPWRQKGTGRARHGSIRSPIWVGGGIAHGPVKEKNYGKKINKKMNTKALFVVLSQKLRDNEIVFLDALKTKAAKTKEAVEILKNFSDVAGFEKMAKKKNKAVLALPGRTVETIRAFRNIPGMTVAEVRNLNILDLLNNKYLILADAKEAVEELQKRVKTSKK